MSINYFRLGFVADQRTYDSDRRSFRTQQETWKLQISSAGFKNPRSKIGAAVIQINVRVTGKDETDIVQIEIETLSIQFIAAIKKRILVLLVFFR